MSLSFNAVRKILPHRFPVALIDRVLELVPNKTLLAIKCVTANEPCFATLSDDASDDACDYPQSLMIESFLQAAGVFLIASMEEAQPAREMVLLFGSLSNCVFHEGARPGDTLEHRVKLERMFAGSAIVSGQSSIAGRVVLEIGQAVVVMRPAQSLEDSSKQL
jgi:3-hydroxyacyl-[acyl-carrier-protein] dehydratase